jgi:hypothetical protein
MVGQFHGIPLKGFRVGVTRIRKADADLPDKAAPTAKNPGNVQLDIGFLSPDRQCMEPTKLAASSDDLPAFATGASQRKLIFFNGKDNCSIPILGACVTIAVNAKSMVQYTRGHAVTSFIS